MLKLGYDSPKHNFSDDQLERRRLALDIAELIRGTPADISARIGIFGSWGTGKTTVLEMLASYLEERGYVIVRFNPATSGSFSDLIGAFADKLVSAFIHNGLYAESRPKSLIRHVRSWLTSKNTLAVVDGLGELHKGAKLANAGLGVLASWLSPDGEQVRKLRASLPESRVLVLIDDLDRCPAELLPRLLLAIREILDIERFTFVLAFDDEIVATGLKFQHPAWGSGHAFLEKILDFRFLLPTIDKDIRVRLLRAEILQRADFIPLGSEHEVQELLPENPRRLKALVRSVLGLRPILDRHDKDEIAWTDIWLVELLRQESNLLIEKLSNLQTFDEILGMHYRLFSRGASRGQVASDSEDKSKLLISSLNLSDQSSMMRIEKLFDAMRARGSDQLHYVFSFANRAPSITWREFTECFTAWADDPGPASLNSWLTRHADKREDSLGRVAANFYQALLNRLSEVLQATVSKTVRNEFEHGYDAAFPLLECLVDFFSTTKFATSEGFILFYNQAQYWVAVRRVRKEIELREAEADALTKAAIGLPEEQALAVLEYLKPWLQERGAWLGSEERAIHGASLREKVAEVLLPQSYRLLIAFLKAPGALKRLGEKDNYQCFKGLLFSKCLPWPSELRQAVFDLIDGQVLDVVGYDFAWSMVTLWKDAVLYRQPHIDGEGVKALLQDRDLLLRTWQAVRNVELMDQGEIKLLTLRAKFIIEGADEKDLPLDDQLAKRVPAFEQHRAELLDQL